MIVSDQIFSLNFNNPESFFDIPSDLVIKILSFLKRSELFSVILTCKQWKCFGENPQLWKKEARVFNVGENTPSLKKVINEKVCGLLSIVQKTDLLLQTRMKTTIELASLMASVACKEKLSEEDRLIKKNALEETNKKRELYQEVKNGLSASFLLKRLSLRKADSLEQYARYLVEQYDDKNGWIAIALDFTSDNQIEKALEIVNGPLNQNVDKSSVIYKIILSLACQNKLGQSIEILRSFIEKQDPYFLKRHWYRDCINTILEYAKEKKNLTAYETTVDLLSTDDKEKDSNIFYLIDTYLDCGDYEQGNRVFKKYHNELLAKTNKYSVRSLIELNIRLGNLEAAKKLARKCKEDDLALYVLRNALERFNFTKEVEAIEKEIESLKKSNPDSR